MFIIVYLYLYIWVVVFTKNTKMHDMVVIFLVGHLGIDRKWREWMTSTKTNSHIISCTLKIRNQANEVYLHKQGKDVSSSNMKLWKQPTFIPPWDFAKSRDAGIFWDGIFLYFLSKDFRETFRDFSRFSFLLYLLVKSDNFHQSINILKPLPKIQHVLYI